MAALRLLFAIAFFLVAVPGMAIAQQNCDDPNLSNLAMKFCLHEEYKRVDAQLNRVWKRAIASIARADHLDNSQRADWKAKLLAAQRHWIKFKDTDCNEAVLYEWWGGTGAGAAISMCLINKTANRIRDLKARYGLQ